MAKAVVTVKIMPESPDVDLKAIEHKAIEKIVEFAGEGERRVTIEPIAFGLKAINIIFVMEESQGSPDKVAEEIAAMGSVNSAEITDVRRAIG